MRLFSAAVLCVLVGCGIPTPSGALGTTLDDVTKISGDANLSASEKRAQLSALGISDIIINGLLRGERLGNQFGGDLRSAFDKVSGDRFPELTPDEIQVYGDAAAFTTYSDTEAAAIANLFVDHGITSASELNTFLDDPSTVLPTEIDETNLRSTFVDFDPDNVLSQLP